jgi:hypothetical protein
VTTANLCNGLVTDKLAHPMTAVAKPARLASYKDPNFGTTVRRITDVVAQFGGEYAKPVYSTMPAWNADESYLLLYVPGQGHKLFNGKTYAFIRELDISPADIEHVYWSSTDSDALYYPSGNKLMVYKPSSNTSITLKTFTGTVSFGDDPIYGDWKSDVFGLSGSVGNILWRQSTVTQKAASVSTQFFTPQVASSGTVYLQGQSVYSAATNALVRTLPINTSEHAATGMYANGQDFWASVQFDGTSATGGNGNLIVTNLTTGVNTAVIGEANGWGYPRVGTHLSAHAFKNPGWVAVSMTGDPVGKFFLEQEIALANVNTGVVCRVAHHRSAGQEGSTGYWAEPHVNISPRGTRMIFASDWNNGLTVDVVELPSYTP